MNSREPSETTRNDAARLGAQVLPAISLTILLAVIGCCAAVPAAADDDKRPAEVTITVVEDPEQLKEKINKIHLPEMHEEARQVQKTGKQTAPEKSSSPTGNQHRNETTDRHPTDPPTAAQHDTSDKPTHAGKVRDDIHHGESRVPR